jgi:hypothetical protein
MGDVIKFPGKKKPKSVDDIILDYQKFHQTSGKGFKDRVKKFESFTDPDNIHAKQFQHHAHYTVFGKPTDAKGYPGAFNDAYKVLDKTAKNDADKIKDVGALTKILETYVDSFLEKAMGKSFKETITHAKKEGADEETLRELKSQLMGQYHTDEDNRPQNILGEKYIKSLKGKKKIDLVDHLRSMSKNISESYSSHLQQKVIRGMFSEEDRLDMAKYIGPKFKKKGWTHKNSHVTRSVGDQATHYMHLIKGAGENLTQSGYKHTMPKEEKKAA